MRWEVQKGRRVERETVIARVKEERTELHSGDRMVGRPLLVDAVAGRGIM